MTFSPDSWSSSASLVSPARGASSIQEESFADRGKRTYVFYKVLMVIAVIGCILLYSLGTIERLFLVFYLSGYGIMSLVYYFATTIFAMCNRRQVNKISREGDDCENPWRPTVGVHVVGYREDPEYLTRCLESVKSLSYTHVESICVVVDGNEPDDMYMVDIAKKVFGSTVTSVVNFETDPRSDPTSFTSVIEGTSSGDFPRVFIISQPHAGKREVIYTSFKISEAVGVEFFLNTDSDTILDSTALCEMVKMTKDRPNIGAVAGVLTIFNANNLLSKLSASRYIMAFNIERASQSFHGVVNCISGPLGLYRVSKVKEIIDSWVDQSFMGKKCTFGDDRHLTNMMLSTGNEVVYTHRSKAATETPTEYSRFVAQQTRWSKSFWREMFLQTGWAYKHWYMMAELVYNTLFPILVVVTLLTVVFTREWSSHIAISVVTICLPLIRCLIVYLLIGCDKVIFYNVLYPFLYFTTLLPVKFVALLTINRTQWGTSSRKKIVRDLTPVIPVIVWNSVLIIGLNIHLATKNRA